MATTVAYRFQVGAHTAAVWTTGDPVLLVRELGFETDTGKFKIGDGTTAWNSLAYYFDPSTLTGGGGGGGSAPTASIQASEAIAAKDFVNVYWNGSAARVRRADASDPTKFANGYAVAAIASAASGTISFTGINSATVSGFAGDVWLSATTPGGIVGTAPSASGQLVQPLGVAVPGVGVIFTLQGRTSYVV